MGAQSHVQKQIPVQVTTSTKFAMNVKCAIYLFSDNLLFLQIIKKRFTFTWFKCVYLPYLPVVIVMGYYHFYILLFCMRRHVYMISLLKIVYNFYQVSVGFITIPRIGNKFVLYSSNSVSESYFVESNPCPAIVHTFPCHVEDCMNILAVSTVYIGTGARAQRY